VERMAGASLALLPFPKRRKRGRRKRGRKKRKGREEKCPVHLLPEPSGCSCSISPLEGKKGEERGEAPPPHGRVKKGRERRKMIVHPLLLPSPPLTLPEGKNVNERDEEKRRRRKKKKKRHSAGYP